MSRAASRALAIFQEAFNRPRDARSPEYQLGVLDALRSKLGEAEAVRCPYGLGTAAADAYFAGCDEGCRRAREHLQQQAQAQAQAQAEEADHAERP